MDRRRKNLVVVGDVASGKTCLVLRFCGGQFEENHVPTVPYTRDTEIVVYSREVDLTIWDTSGIEGYSRNSCPDVDIFIACFAVNNRRSFQVIRQRFLLDMAGQQPGVPILLVGTKNDLRGTEQPLDEAAQPLNDAVQPLDVIDQGPMVTRAEGVALRQAIGAAGYAECSALTGEGVREAFIRAVKVTINHWRCKTCCNIS